MIFIIKIIQCILNINANLINGVLRIRWYGIHSCSLFRTLKQKYYELKHWISLLPKFLCYNIPGLSSLLLFLRTQQASNHGGNNGINYGGHNAMNHGGNNAINDGGNAEINHGGNNAINNGGNDTINHGGNDAINDGGNNAINHAGNDAINDGGNNAINHGGNNTINHGGNDAINDGGNNNSSTMVEQKEQKTDDEDQEHLISIKVKAVAEYLGKGHGEQEWTKPALKFYSNAKLIVTKFRSGWYYGHFEDYCAGPLGWFPSQKVIIIDPNYREWSFPW